MGVHMKPLVILKKLRKIGIFFTVIVIGLGVIGIAWAIRKIFNYRISDAMIAASIAALSLIYEINKSKKLNEAEFLIHLNSLFITNDDYKKVYNVLSNYSFEEEPDCMDITNGDISNYLTLFETFYILLKRKVIDMKLLDDLFAYRFFLAVHNPYIQRKKLAVSPKNFKNIFRLERIWLKYRSEHTPNENYFPETYHLINRSDFQKYLAVFTPREQKKIIKERTIPTLKESLGYTFTPLNISHYDVINRMQKDAVLEAEKVHKGMLRANRDEMIKSCLQKPHITQGIMHGGKLIGFGILYDPSGIEEENLFKELPTSKYFEDITHADIMHVKLIIIEPKHKGNHLQVHITRELEKQARKMGKKLLLTTVSPHNVASVKNTVKAGFTYNKTITKYDGAVRLIFHKKLI